jgi:putative membrane protein
MRATIMLASWVLCSAAPVIHAQSQPAKAPAAQTSLSADEVQTLNKLHVSNLREIAAGELATKRARTEPVKNFGELLIKHHTQADRELQAFASRAGVKLAEHKTDLGELEKTFNPANFDRYFADQMAREHREAIATVEAAMGKAANPDLKALLDKTLPQLKQHYKIAVQLVQDNPF